MFPRARFFSPDPLPRQIRFSGDPDTDFSQKTLDALIRVEVKDPLDAEWLAEKAFYTARNPALTEKEVEQLVGRKQRVTGKNVSISQSNKNVQDNLDGIREMLAQNMTLNTAEQQLLFNRLTAALQTGITGLTTDVQALGPSQAANTQLVVDAIGKLNLPNNPANLGIPQVVDSKGFANQQGQIVTYIISQDPSKTPIKTPLGLATIEKAQKQMQRDPNLVLDLQTLSLVNKNLYTPIKTRSFTRGNPALINLATTPPSP